MRNKTGIIVLTVVLTALCIYFISFTFIDRGIRKKAVSYATNSTGQVDFAKKQHYLDSIYNKPVYNFLGLKSYTYKEIKQNGLNLGLDLQGGMHVTLEVSPVAILKGLSGNSQDPDFLKALTMAKQMQKNSQEPFTSLFYKAFKEVAPGKSLASVFYNYANRQYISSPTASDQEVMKFIDKEVDQAIDRTFQILRTRIDRFGVTSPNIQRIQGTGRIQVELPGADNPERVRNLLQGVAKLEFLEVWTPRELQPYLVRMNDYLVSKSKAEEAGKAAKSKSQPNQTNEEDLLTESSRLDSLGTVASADSAAADTSATAAQDSLDQKVSKLFSLAVGNSLQFGQLVYPVNDTAQIGKILRDPKIQAILPPNLEFLWQKPGKEDQVIELVPVKKGKFTKAPLTGEVITDARWDFASSGRRGIEVTMSMNASGAKKWSQMTRKAVETGTADMPSRIAIVLDNVVWSAPTVREEIPNGNSSITGNFTEEEAKDLANVLKAGKLPAPARIVEEGIIGPSLGKEAISQGLKSSLAGLVLVVIFMVMYYSSAGLIANFALLFNIFFILGILAQLQAALTLPGIAGIVLTMGMAVDANVLIYERVREELRQGKSVQAAIKEGYQKAFSAIFDSNLTTILIGIILAWLGTGPVQGFATTLIVGILTSFFSAVFISRVIIEFMSNRKSLNEKSFETFLSRNFMRNMHFDFIKQRRKAYIFSSTLIVAGMVAIFASGGLNLGVDFKGGRSYIVQFDEPVVASDVRSQVSDDFKNKGTEVKTYGDNKTLKVTTSYLIDDESSAADSTVKAALEQGLVPFKADHPKIIGSEKVGATIADDIMDASIVSVIISLIAIFIYVVFRFRRWQFGLGALIALAHDVLVAISIYGIATALGFNLEVDQIFIAAILTVIGYSVNDTVVVFDRIREKTEAHPKMELGAVMNEAINETMSRTIITALTVFIVVVVLFIFGGEVLRGFSLVMIIGSIFGTYSSVYIATPVVLDFGRKKRETGSKKESLKPQNAGV